MLEVHKRQRGQLRAVIYNRVSADPTGKRVSVESQDRENHAWCEREGWLVAGVVTDNDRSASRYAARDREGFARIRRALDGRGEFGRVDVLVAWESSRASRDLGDYVALRDACAEHNVAFAYAGRIYDLNDAGDRLSTGLHALMDEQEADKIRARILRSHRDSARAGKPRGVVPYGYMREYDQQTGRMAGQVPDPETAPVVQGIVKRLLAGDTLYSIAADLNARGVLTPRQHRDQRRGVTSPPDRDRGWSPTQIRHLLTKESLKGVRVHRGGEARGATWEPIVRPADWAKVQKLLTDRSRFTPARGVQPAYLLSGIAECSVCGGWLRPLRNNGRMTYACAGKTDTSSSGHVSRGQELLDAFVTVHFVGLLSHPDMLQALSPDPAVDDELAAAQRIVEDLQADIDHYRRLATQPGPDRLRPDVFVSVIGDLEAQLRAAQARLTPDWIPDSVMALVGADAASRWENSSLHIQRTALRALVRVIVKPVPAERRGRPAVTPELVEIRWRLAR